MSIGVCFTINAIVAYSKKGLVRAQKAAFFLYKIDMTQVKKHGKNSLKTTMDIKLKLFLNLSNCKS